MTTPRDNISQFVQETENDIRGVDNDTLKTVSDQIDILGTKPNANSANNATLFDVIGNKDDDESGTSLYAKNYITDKHQHSAQQVYPTLANGVALNGGAGAWQLSAAYIEVIPAGTIRSPFDIHFCNIGLTSAADTYEVHFFKGAAGAEDATAIAKTRFTRIAGQGGTSPVQCQTVILPADTRISAKLASASGGDTAVVSLYYHIY